MIRDVHCRSLVLVDESSKKIFINDGTYNFSDVKQFNYRSDGNKCIAEFMMSSGEKPIKKIYFFTEDDMVNSAARIGNALNLT